MNDAGTSAARVAEMLAVQMVAMCHATGLGQGLVAVQQVIADQALGHVDQADQDRLLLIATLARARCALDLHRSDTPDRVCADNNISAPSDERHFAAPVGTHEKFRFLSTVPGQLQPSIESAEMGDPDMARIPLMWQTEHLVKVLVGY